MNAKNILALDIASATGWAVSMTSGSGADAVTEVQSGTNIVTVYTSEGDGGRYVRFENWCFTMIEKYKPEVVYYEEVHRIFGPGVGQARLYFSFRSMLLAACSRRNVKVVGISVGDNKVIATDNGAASKPEMIAAARRFFPDQVVKDDNQADALNLLRCGRFHETNAFPRELEAAKARSKVRQKVNAKAKGAAKRKTKTPEFVMPAATKLGGFIG